MIIKELLKTVQQALELKKEVTLNDSVDTLKEWDSIGHLAILVAIDKKLSGKAGKIKKLVHCQSVKTLADTLRKNKLLQN